MAFIDQKVDRPVEQYMELITRMDQLIEESKAKLEANPDQHQETEKLDDLHAIRKQLVDHVKEKGIGKDILENTRRLLSIF